MIARNDAAEPRIAAHAASTFRLGLRLAACGLMVLACQCIVWFEQGDWARIDLHTVLVWLALPAPLSDLPFAQMLIDLLFRAPLSALLIVLGGSFACAGAASAGTGEAVAQYRR